MSEPSDALRPKRPAVTDSPWFWVLLFSLAGLAALLLISSQYAKRQRRLEMQYQARQEMTRRQVTGEPKARASGEEGDAAPPAPGELIIPLWPVAVALVVVAAVAARMLVRSRATAAAAIDTQRGAPP
jgi:hypothetical protein